MAPFFIFYLIYFFLNVLIFFELISTFLANLILSSMNLTAAEVLLAFAALKSSKT
jgi:hypothetical protein